MNYTINLTQSFLYSGVECMQWCEHQLQYVENTLYGGTYIIISVVVMMIAFVLKAITKEHLTYLGLVKPKDAYAFEVKMHKIAAGLIDASFLIQALYLLLYAIKGMGWL